MEGSLSAYSLPKLILRDEGCELRSEDSGTENFHSRFREELLSAEIFEDLEDAQRKISAWVKWYNTERPHSLLGHQAPSEVFNKRRMGSTQQKDTSALPNPIPYLLKKISLSRILRHFSARLFPFPPYLLPLHSKTTHKKFYEIACKSILHLLFYPTLSRNISCFSLGISENFFDIR